MHDGIHKASHSVLVGMSGCPIHHLHMSIARVAVTLNLSWIASSALSEVVSASMPVAMMQRLHVGAACNARDV